MCASQYLLLKRDQAAASMKVKYNLRWMDGLTGQINLKSSEGICFDWMAALVTMMQMQMVKTPENLMPK